MDNYESSTMKGKAMSPEPARFTLSSTKRQRAWSREEEFIMI